MKKENIITPDIFLSNNLVLCTSLPADNHCKPFVDPDQALQNDEPDLGPNFDTLVVFLEDFFEKVKNNFKKNGNK